MEHRPTTASGPGIFCYGTVNYMFFIPFNFKKTLSVSPSYFLSLIINYYPSISVKDC